MVLRAVGVGLVFIASFSGGCIPQRLPTQPAVIVVTNVQAKELESVDEPAAPEFTEEVIAEEPAAADGPSEDDEPDP